VWTIGGNKQLQTVCNGDTSAGAPNLGARLGGLLGCMLGASRRLLYSTRVVNDHVPAQHAYRQAEDMAQSSITAATAESISPSSELRKSSSAAGSRAMWAREVCRRIKETAWLKSRALEEY